MNSITKEELEGNQMTTIGNKIEIRDTLEAVYNKLSNNHEVFFVALFGSQNYGLDTEESDIDIKAVVLPSIDDLINKRTISEVHEHDRGIVEIKDISEMIKMWMKCNINFTEILFTEHILVNPKYQEFWNELQSIRDDIVEHDKYRFLQATLGMMRKKRKELRKVTEKNKDKIEKHGYDSKQLMHIIRLGFFCVDFLKGVCGKPMKYKDSLRQKGLDKDLLLSIKSYTNNELHLLNNGVEVDDIDVFVENYIKETEAIDIIGERKFLDLTDFRDRLIKFSIFAGRQITEYMTTFPRFGLFTAVSYGIGFYHNHDMDFSFHGTLKQEDSDRIIKIMNSLISRNPLEKINIIDGTVCIKMLGTSCKIPIEYMGSGERYFLQLLLCLFDQTKPVIFIDSLESRVHYSLIREAIKILWSIAKEKGKKIILQVFSYETLQRINDILIDDQSLEGDFAFIRLDKDQHGEEEYNIYDSKLLKAAIKHNWEIR